MRTDTTICINSKVNGKQPSLEHRIYSIEGIAPALTTGFHYLVGYYEERALGADAPENNLAGGGGADIRQLGTGLLQLRRAS